MTTDKASAPGAGGTGVPTNEAAQGQTPHPEGHQAPMTPEQISGLIAAATKSMNEARKDLGKVGAAVQVLAEALTGDINKLDKALEGNMVSMEKKVRGFCDLSIEAGRQAQAYHAVLEKNRD